MKKIFLIGWKDVTLAFRDRAALILMLAAPFLLTIGLGFVTGRLSGGSGSGLSQIPVLLVNQDGGQLGNSLVELFQSKELAELVAPTILTDPAQARQQVDEDKTTAAVIIPPGFSASIIPQNGSVATSDVVEIELYANPSSPTSAGIIQAIVEEFVSRVEVGRVSGRVVVEQLVLNGLIQPADAPAVGAAIGTRQGTTTGDNSAIKLNSTTTGGEAVSFNVMAYMAPGMALMFLMFTVSNGGRSLLSEKAHGTLPRLVVAPITTTQVLAGKVVGIFLTGTAQMLILILTSTLLFQLKWGNPLGVLLLVLAAVTGSCGWGMLITALAKTPGQVSAIGSAVMLSFGILGGSFTNNTGMPTWFQLVSKITPNAWGLDGFTTLASGAPVTGIVTPILALLGMGVVLFSTGVVLLNRRGFFQR